VTRRWAMVWFVGVFGAVLFPGRAWADIYTYTDSKGVVHFTNLRKRGRHWKVLYRTGPGKAATFRGCKRCDRVPARDRSSARFTRYDSIIDAACGLYKIPKALVKAVIYVESNYDPRVVSSVGAKGLMQLMPHTAKDMGVANVFDPRQNIFGGVRFLRVLANLFNGDLVLTIAGYHAGAGAIRKYHGVPPYLTTQKYVRAVLARYYRYRRAEQRKASTR